MTTTDIYPVAVTVTLETRIRGLWQQRQHDRRWLGAEWTPARHDRETELRAFLRLRSSARRLARRTVEQADPVTAAKAYAELGYHAAQAAYR